MGGESVVLHRKRKRKRGIRWNALGMLYSSKERREDFLKMSLSVCTIDPDYYLMKRYLRIYSCLRLV